MWLRVPLSSAPKVTVFPSRLMADVHADHTPKIISLGARIGSSAGLAVAQLSQAAQYPTVTAVIRPQLPVLAQI